jgi:hypothetical protein
MSCTFTDKNIRRTRTKYIYHSKYSDRRPKVKRTISIGEIHYYKRELCYAMLSIGNS